MKLAHNVSLKPYNTFGMDVTAADFAVADTVDEVQEIIKSNKDIFILGGGSNILFTQNPGVVVVKNNLQGTEFTDLENGKTRVKAMSGNNWHQLVLECVEKGLGGIENLSLIPGTVGAAPMQNIGAYGVEIKECLEEVEAMEIATGAIKIFTNEECRFGYRESIFKHEAKGKYFILSVSLLLKKNAEPNTSYAALADALHQKGIIKPTIKEVSDVVCEVRSSKLPNPAEIGNAGSFFKNPEVALSFYRNLLPQYPDMPSYKISENKVKIPAAWLIEKCRWKGWRRGNYGCHSRQALVLVNYGGAQGNDIKILSEEIRESVKEKFGISLQTEVNIL